MLAAALTSCGKSGKVTATESKTTVTTTETTSKDSADNSNEQESTAANNNSESIGIDRETAVSNVKELAGSGAKIVSVTE